MGKEKKDAPHTLDNYVLNRDFCDWAARNFQLLERMWSLNIKVHNNEDDLLGKGQIFLFNHFARFETLVPPYIIHRDAGAYCRSVADYKLFEANEKLSKLMRDTGVVPNNLPGLLPFLAAEILRGRKVVIFPEGGMIKDRRVMDDEGRLGIFSPALDNYRKHRRGAAVLALMLELFKRRIRDVCEAGNQRRMEHWCTALGMGSVAELREQADKPTLIVPGTITFYPIRIDDNILSRGVDFFSKNLPEQFLEEMVVEGNILLKDTDMDIRLGQPIQPHINWRWWEKALLGRYFEEIDSLADLFGLRHDTANHWTERLLVRAFARETGRIRDDYMQGMYEGITVNLAHLASVIITALMAKKRQEVTCTELVTALYLALKYLQNKPGAHLHRGLAWPDRYKDLLDGRNEDLERFLDMCIQARLLEKTETGSYRFLDKLREEFGYHSVRLENPVLVSVNEVRPVEEVQEAVKKALKRSKKPNESELSAFLFDDEIRRYRWNCSYYSKKRYSEINDRETATRSGEPYLLDSPKKRSRIGILLVHGFTASPAELREFGEHLHQKGHAVMGVRLSGHGTSPWDLHHRTKEEWLASVQRGYRILAALCDKVVMIGFSMGGGLSLMHAANQPEKLIGVATVCAPLAVQDKNISVVPLMNQINKIASWFSSDDGGGVPFYTGNPEHKDINYCNMPVNALNELRGVMNAVPKVLAKVDVPALVIQSDKDTVVIPQSAQEIFDGLGSEDKKLHWIASSRHGLINEHIDNTWDLLEGFIGHAAKAKRKKK